MSSDIDTLESVTKGVTKGFLEFTTDQIKLLVKRIIDKDLIFIKDQETIDIAKALRTKGEYEFFCQHIKDKDMRILFQMGLTLREYEIKKKNMENLITKIKNKYSRKGKYIAYFVQNGLFSKYVGIMLDRTDTRKQLSLEIYDFFDNIEHRVVYITNDDFPGQKAEEIIIKIQSISPDTFIISSIGSSAMSTCETIKNKVMEKLLNTYSCEEYSSDISDRKIYFIIKKP